VHVGASLFHDVEPCAKLGLPCVWIDRVGEASELPRAGRLPDLTGLPDLLDRLTPA
jgi:FMN phosphatase YigB (HAD superfamily)